MNYELDVLASNNKEAYANGRQNLNVKVLRWGLKVSDFKISTI